MEKASHDEEVYTPTTRLQKRPPTPQSRESVTPRILMSSQKKKLAPLLSMITQMKIRVHSPKDSTNIQKKNLH
jgi:hypothetical protein